MTFTSDNLSNEKKSEEILTQAEYKDQFNHLTTAHIWKELKKRLKNKYGAKIKKTESNRIKSKGKVWQNYLAKAEILKVISDFKIGSDIYMASSLISIDSTQVVY